MNTASVAMICVALIATPAGYAVERLYHERASGHAVSPVAPDRAAADPIADGDAAWLKQQMRASDAMYRSGRV
jgi:hypothetical protein